MSSAPEPRAAAPRFSLVALLAFVAGSELLINRILGHLLSVDPLMPRTLGRRVFGDVRLFLYELTAVLSVLMLGSALARIATGGTHYRIGARVSFAIVGFGAVILSALGAVAELPPDLFLELHLSFICLLMLVTLAVVLSRTPAAIRLGTVTLLLPAVLHFAARLMRRISPTPELTSMPLELEAVAQATLAAAAVVVLACFASRRHGMKRGITLAALMVGCAAVIVRADWDTAARIAAYGFGLALPMQPWALLVYLLAFGSFTYTVVTLLASPGPERLRGLGLLLIGMAGLDAQAPFQLTLAALGFLAIAESALRGLGTPMPRAEFENLVRRAAAAVGAPQVTMTGPAGYETARLHAPPTATLPVALTVARQAGLVSALDVVVGEKVPRDPPFTIERRGVPRLGPRADGAAIDTGDAGFDQTFTTRDRRGLHAQLLDDATRARLHESCRGWIGVWPQRGVRYRADALAPGEDALPVLIELLRELAARAA